MNNMNPSIPTIPSFWSVSINSIGGSTLTSGCFIAPIESPSFFYPRGFLVEDSDDWRYFVSWCLSYAFKKANILRLDFKPSLFRLLWGHEMNGAVLLSLIMHLWCWQAPWRALKPIMLSGLCCSIHWDQFKGVLQHLRKVSFVLLFNLLETSPLAIAGCVTLQDLFLVVGICDRHSILQLVFHHQG